MNDNIVFVSHRAVQKQHQVSFDQFSSFTATLSMALHLSQFCTFPRKRKATSLLVFGYIRKLSQVLGVQLPSVLTQYLQKWVDGVIWLRLGREEIEKLFISTNSKNYRLKSRPFIIRDFIFQLQLFANIPCSHYNVNYIGFFWQILKISKAQKEAKSIKVRYELNCAQIADWNVECEITLHRDEIERINQNNENQKQLYNVSKTGWKWYKSISVENTMKDLNSISFGIDIIGIWILNNTETKFKTIYHDNFPMY